MYILDEALSGIVKSHWVEARGPRQRQDLQRKVMSGIPCFTCCWRSKELFKAVYRGSDEAEKRGMGGGSKGSVVVRCSENVARDLSPLPGAFDGLLSSPHSNNLIFDVDSSGKRYFCKYQKKEDFFLAFECQESSFIG